MRSRRKFLDINGFAPVHLPTSTYYTDAQAKSDKMKCTIEDDIFKNLHLLSDPLKKNLADSVITGETMKKNPVETKERKTHEAVKPPTAQRTDYYPSLSGITSFFSGVFNIMGTIFQKRTSSPVSQYYDCFDNEYKDQMAPPMFWQPSNFEVRNKNESDMLFGSTNDSRTNLDVEMNSECKVAVAQCEEKLNQVRSLLCKKNDQNVPKARGSPRKPRKAFVEAGSVEESFEDALSESVLSLANDTFVECCAPFKIHDESLIQSDAPRIKTDIYITENMNIPKNLPEETESKTTEVKQNLNTENLSNSEIEISVTKTKDELVSSCEDKLNKIKELLRSRHCKTPKNSEPIPISTGNKIETLFGNEMNSSDLLTSSNSQDSDHFNEITGRFNSSSVDSEDSFQIVFTDSPRKCRRRIPSDCESEDSFIVFEESPDCCYTSNEVFGEEILGDDSSDSDSDVDDDSGCGVQCKLSPSLSRTFGNLADDSLYDQDVVDSASVSSPSTTTPWLEKTGLLLDEDRKSERKMKPTKRVHFSTEPPKVHIMRVWAFAARQARAGHWERHALDRERFKRRIADVEMAISWVLKPQHRTRVVFQRFRPWWNAQKRKELAEKKEAEEAEKRRMIEGENNASDEILNNCDKSIPEVVENRSNDPNLNQVETKNVVNVDNNITQEVKISQNIVNIDNTTKLSQNQNYRDQNVNTQVNDSYEKIDKISDINDSKTIKSNDESLMKNGLLIKNCCIDT